MNLWMKPESEFRTRRPNGFAILCWLLLGILLGAGGARADKDKWVRRPQMRFTPAWESPSYFGNRFKFYPMTAADLREWLKSVSVTGWEWSETNGWVSASQLRCAPPLGHLFAYLLASNFLVPMQAPVEA
jgi:hypothetical protein